MMATPKQIELTNDERDALLQRIQQSNLGDEDKDIIVGLLGFNGWLQMQLLEKRISIGRLRTMIFGEVWFFTGKPLPHLPSLPRCLDKAYTKEHCHMYHNPPTTSL